MLIELNSGDTVDVSSIIAISGVKVRTKFTGVSFQKTLYMEYHCTDHVTLTHEFYDMSGFSGMVTDEDKERWSQESKKAWDENKIVIKRWQELMGWDIKEIPKIIPVN